MIKQICLLSMAVLFCAALLSSCQPPAQASHLQSPQYVVEQREIDFSKVEEPDVHTSEKGVKVIVPDGYEAGSSVPPDGKQESPMVTGEAPEEAEPITPDTVWQEDSVVTYNSYTLPGKAALNNDGCVGILSIPAISLNMNVYESDNEMEAMLHGGAHYKSTSCYDGNVGISAHVSGVPSSASFENLHKLEAGDTITYQTAIGTRSYKVAEVKEIAQDDWSYLGRTTDNRITLTTCITGQPEKRLLVQAIQEQ